MTTQVIHRGEVWLVNLNPTIGAEIQKERPAIVISTNSIGKLPIKLIAPITAWKASFKANLWHVQLSPNQTNGLTKPSAVDTLQIRGVDIARFVKKIGMLESAKLEEIIQAITVVIGHSGKAPSSSIT